MSRQPALIVALLLALSLLGACAEAEPQARPQAESAAATPTAVAPTTTAAPSAVEPGTQATTLEIADILELRDQLAATPHRFEVFVFQDDGGFSDLAGPAISGAFDGEWSSGQMLDALLPGGVGDPMGFMVTNGAVGYFYTPGFPSIDGREDDVLALARDQWIFIDPAHLEGGDIEPISFTPSSFDVLESLGDIAAAIVSIEAGPPSEVRGERTQTFNFVSEPEADSVFTTFEVTGTLHLDVEGNLRSVLTASDIAASRVDFFDIGEPIAVELPTDFVDAADVPRIVSIPPVNGRTAADALRTLEGLELEVDTIEDFSNDVPFGLVIGTEPSAGSVVAVGDLITMIVSSGPQLVALPSLIGLDQDSALEELAALGLVGVPVTQFTDNPGLAGTVIDTIPGATVLVESGSEVQVVIAIGS